MDTSSYQAIVIGGWKTDTNSSVSKSDRNSASDRARPRRAASQPGDKPNRPIVDTRRLWSWISVGSLGWKIPIWPNSINSVFCPLGWVAREALKNTEKVGLIFRPPSRPGFRATGHSKAQTPATCLRSNNSQGSAQPHPVTSAGSLFKVIQSKDSFNTANLSLNFSHFLSCGTSPYKNQVRHPM